MRRRSPSPRRRAGAGAAGEGATSAAASPAGSPSKLADEVLHEVDLVDVAAGDRGANLADGRRVVLRRPGRLPVADPERRLQQTVTCVRRADPGRGDGQRARLRRRRPGLSAAVSRPARSRGRRRRRALRRSSPARYCSSASSAPSGSCSSSTDGLRRMTQEAHAELEIGHRHPLVGRVDQPCRGLGVHRPRREEAVGDGAERLRAASASP